MSYISIYFSYLISLTNYLCVCVCTAKRLPAILFISSRNSFFCFDILIITYHLPFVYPTLYYYKFVFRAFKIYVRFNFSVIPKISRRSFYSMPYNFIFVLEKYDFSMFMLKLSFSTYRKHSY